jgi:predicted nicotinamide N-methyase
MVISKILPESMVVLTDGDDESLTLLQRNLQDPKNQIDFNKVKATCLRWNENMEDFDKWCRKHNSYCKNSNSSATTSPENLEIFPDDIEISNSPSDPVYFDIILAGDVLYKPELPNAFFDTVTRYLAPTTGVLWLCHVPRSSVTHDLVEDIARDKGFSIHEVRTHFINCPKTIGGISDEDRVHEDWENAIVYQLQRS